MNISKNIEYDPLITTSEKKAVHLHHLNIATLNLDDINLRFGTDVRLKYNDKKYKFELLNYTPFASSTQNEINRFCKWALQDNKNTAHWVDPFTRSVEDDKYEALMYANNPFFSDKRHFDHLKDEFIKAYKDYYPKGFLDREVEIFIKDKLNSYCEELSEDLEK